MVVNHSHALLSREEGQSILEVVFVLPFLFLFVALLFRLNMSIQTSINNTQYARSQVYVLTANSPEYPRLQFRHYSPNIFSAAGQDMMVLGVADPEALNQSSSNGTDMEPMPQTQKIGRKGTTVKGSGERGEQAKRTEIRIRNTSAICTQFNAINPKTPFNSNGVMGLGSSRWPFKMPVCQYKGMDGV